MKDKLGNELEVGHRVAFGVGGRRSYGLRLGQVLELVGATNVRVYSEYARRSGVEKASDVVRVMTPEDTEQLARLADLEH